MIADIAVVVATYGNLDEWGPLAERAAWSALMQSVEPAQVVHFHGANVADARNRGAAETDTEWLVFLDADDTLNAGYIAAMAASADGHDTSVLHQPQTLGVHEDGHEDDEACFIPAAPSLLQRNHLIIGTMVSRKLFEAAGGFDPAYPVAEDWALWLGCWVNGATWVQVPDAVYRVSVRSGSRNQAPITRQAPVISRIRRRYTAEASARGLL